MVWCIILFWIWNDDNIPKIAMLIPPTVIFRHVKYSAKMVSPAASRGHAYAAYIVLLFRLFKLWTFLSVAIAKLLVFPVLSPC